MSSLFLGSFIVLAGSWCADLGCWKGCCKPGKLVALPLLSAYLFTHKHKARHPPTPRRRRSHFLPFLASSPQIIRTSLSLSSVSGLGLRQYNSDSAFVNERVIGGDRARRPHPSLRSRASERASERGAQLTKIGGHAPQLLPPPPGRRPPPRTESETAPSIPGALISPGIISGSSPQHRPIPPSPWPRRTTTSSSCSSSATLASGRPACSSDSPRTLSTPPSSRQ